MSPVTLTSEPMTFISWPAHDSTTGNISASFLVEITSVVQEISVHKIIDHYAMTLMFELTASSMYPVSSVFASH